ncbi:MAG TPA: response regulator transcription factor [Nitrospira sp.]|nr:response regulator transcription factor [Nitrospira sp.]
MASQELKSVPRRTSLVLADDNASLLDRERQLLACEFDVLAAATDGLGLIELVEQLDPDVVVLDISMPHCDGLDAARRLKTNGIRAKIVFLTVHDDPDFLREGLKAGGVGYVIKDQLVSDLPCAIHAAVAGRTFVSVSPNLQL